MHLHQEFLDLAAGASQQLLVLWVPALLIEKRERATAIQREREPGAQWPR